MQTFKKIAVVAIIVMTASAVFAQDDSAQTTSTVTQVQALIDNGLFKNADEIRVLARSLTPGEAWTLYDQNEKPAWNTVFNMIGLGIGNWIQGDITGGLISTLGQTAGLGLMIGGSVLALTSFDEIMSGDSRKAFSGLAVMGAGTVVLVGFQIFSIVRGTSYPTRYNGTLRSVLNPSGNESVSAVALAPSFYFDKNNNPTAAVAVRVAF